MESANINIEAGALEKDPNCEEEQDNMKKEDEAPEATELGASELAFEDRMIKDMDKSDTVFVNDNAFEPMKHD
jgi:hypothetical protein